jgi:hypothetical protein
MSMSEQSSTTEVANLCLMRTGPAMVEPVGIEPTT